MLDNGDGTYLTNYKCNVAGTLTIIIYLMVDGAYVEYYNNIMFSTPITNTGILTSLYQSWGSSAIITGYTNNVGLNLYASLKAPSTNNFEFQLNSQDGSDMYFNDNRVVSNLGTTCTCSDTFSQSLAQNMYYDIKISYLEMNSNAYLYLYWNISGSQGGISNSYIFHKEYVANSPFNVIVECPTYYNGDNPDHPGECYENCGDGHRIGREICDDGNSISGDGCNSKCNKIEDPNWICTGGEDGLKDTCTKCTTGYDRNSELSKCMQIPVPDSIESFMIVIYVLVGIEIFFSILYSILTKSTIQSMLTMLNFFQMIVLFYGFDMNTPTEINGLLQSLKGYLMNLSFMSPSGMKDYSYPNCDFFTLKISMCKTLGLIGFESIYAYNNILVPFLFLMIIVPLHLIFLCIYFLHLKIQKSNNKTQPNKILWYIFRFTTFTFYIRFFQIFYVLMIMSSVSELIICFAGEGNEEGSCFFSSVLFLFCFLISACASWQFFKSQFNYTFFKMIYFREYFRGLRTKWHCRLYAAISVLKRFILVFCVLGFYKSPIKVKFSFFLIFQLSYLIVIVSTFPFAEIKDNIREIVTEFIYTLLSLFMLRNGVAGTLSDSVVSCFKFLIIANISISLVVTIGGLAIKLFHKYCLSKIMSKSGRGSSKYKFGENQDERIPSESQNDPSQADMSKFTNLELERQKEKEKYDRLQDYYNRRQNIFNPMRFEDLDQFPRNPQIEDHEIKKEIAEDVKQKEIPYGLQF